jgi:hypothetical protein
VGLRLVVPEGSIARASLQLAGVLSTIDVDETPQAALAAVGHDPS